MIPVEVYSRVVGYFRPVDQWNKGKREEFSERTEMKIRKYPSAMKCHCGGEIEIRSQSEAKCTSCDEYFFRG
jgi:Zn finger protein HypA/HybF involved in hydrogenase expression